MKLHIAETQDFSPRVLELLKTKFDLSVGHVERSNLKQKLQEIDIFWFRLAHQLNCEVINNKTLCKFLVSPVTGIDHIDEVLCKKHNIEIICLRGEKEFLKEIRATSEHTIFLMMALMRKAVPAVLDVTAGHWRRDLFRGFELYKKKVGIVGYGRLGSIVADYCHAFGCKVGFYDIEEKKHPTHIKRFNSLKDCIKQSDIISIHIPYNESTHHIFDNTCLEYFDNSKWLINTSRGGVVDEMALLQSLKNKKIAGAALDVLCGEPEVSNNPLVEFAKNNHNLIITPHIGGCTFDSFEKTEIFIAQKLIKSLSHQAFI